MSTIHNSMVAHTLEELHELAMADPKKQEFSNNALRYMAVSLEEGRFLNLIARIGKYKNIVEFGCSFGISTIYLAAAAKDNSGKVITSEMEISKAAVARKNLEKAGLSELVEIREGDAIKTLSDIDKPVDLLFLDGAKDLYFPIFKMLKPKLSPGAAIIADNVDKPETHPLVDYLLQEKENFTTVILFDGRVLLAYCK